MDGGGDGLVADGADREEGDVEGEVEGDGGGVLTEGGAQGVFAHVTAKEGGGGD